MVQLLPLNAERLTRRTLNRLLPAAVALCVAAGLVGCQQSGRFAQGGVGANVYGAPVASDTLEQNRVPAPPPAPPPPLQARADPVRFPAAWAPRTSARPWRWIVIHHSATPDGGAARFDKEHRGNGWDELGYHFVIGNGSDTRNGQVEVGARWVKQKHGAHAKTPDNRFNDYGIGICLVGNFETGRPTKEQMQSLANLVAYLMQRYDIPQNRVIGHEDTGRSTACPGHNLESQLAMIRRAAAQAVASGFAAPEAEGRMAMYATDRRD